MTGLGDFVNVDGQGMPKGYNFTRSGVGLGIDYRITDRLAIGVMVDSLTEAPSERSTFTSGGYDFHLVS